MADIAAIQALSSIAETADSSSRPEAPSGRAPLSEWFGPGLMLELSSPRVGVAACTSVTATQVARVQARGEPVAWIEGGVGLYPPDLWTAGVDLTSLVVVRPPGAQVPILSAEQQAVRAAEVLLRSGAFGLVVLDLSVAVPPRAMVWLAKLHGLLRLHASRLLVLRTAESETESLGPQVSLRVEPRCTRLSADRWQIDHVVLKNKLGREVRVAPEVRTSPEGAASMWPGGANQQVSSRSVFPEGLRPESEHAEPQEHCA